MIGNDWDNLLCEEYKKDYFIKLQKFIIEEYKNKIIYPKMSEIFNAFTKTKYEDVKVVIIGQDPYHGENEAEGLSFSVKVGIAKPPSLINIFSELKSDLNIDPPNHGSLVSWATQGVLLLNSTLTVVKDTPKSHSNKGWETFTDEVIKLINKKETPVVFILWGSDARSKKYLITNKKHFIIESAHPSPLSAYRGFFGSKPFSKTNDFLIKNNIKPINWKINNV
jgi:uracil-DNA glycosylase